jgi:hypothetical protein
MIKINGIPGDEITDFVPVGMNRLMVLCGDGKISYFEFMPKTYIYGQIALSKKNFFQLDNDEIWTAGQAFLILRPQGAGAIETLYEYLTNDIVQDHLASLASGTTISMLNAKEVELLQIPALTEKEHQSVKEAFHARQKHFEAIDEIHALIATERAKSWPHNELKTNSNNPSR